MGEPNWRHRRHINKNNNINPTTRARRSRLSRKSCFNLFILSMVKETKTKKLSPALREMHSRTPSHLYILHVCRFLSLTLSFLSLSLSLSFCVCVVYISNSWYRRGIYFHPPTTYRVIYTIWHCVNSMSSSESQWSTIPINLFFQKKAIKLEISLKLCNWIRYRSIVTWI